VGKGRPADQLGDRHAATFGQRQLGRLAYQLGMFIFIEQDTDGTLAG